MNWGLWKCVVVIPWGLCTAEIYPATNVDLYNDHCTKVSNCLLCRWWKVVALLGRVKHRNNNINTWDRSLLSTLRNMFVPWFVFCFFLSPDVDPETFTYQPQAIWTSRECLNKALFLLYHTHRIFGLRVGNTEFCAKSQILYTNTILSSVVLWR